MRVRKMLVGSMLLFATSGLVSCGDDDSIPTAEELSESLITADDLEGEWTLSKGPDDDQKLDPSGILTDEQRELVPSFDLCDRADEDAQRVAETLRPLLFRQMDLTVDDGIDPPFDRSGHMIFMQQFMYAGDPGEMEESFDIVKSGMLACLGELPAGEEGPGFAEELDVPEVGDDRLGVLMTMEEAGGWAEWRIQEALLRDGPILMKFVVVDIRAGDDPYFTTEEFGDMVSTAAAKL